MSLLMDALRKAEDARRRAGNSASRPELAAELAAELTLEPLPAPAPAPATRLPDLAEHSAALDAGLSAVAREAQAGTGSPAPKSATAAKPNDDAARAAARNVFAAKISAPARGKAWPIIGVLGVAGEEGGCGSGRALPGNACSCHQK